MYPFRKPVVLIQGYNALLVNGFNYQNLFSNLIYQFFVEEVISEYNYNACYKYAKGKYPKWMHAERIGYTTVKQQYH
jgi:hypothetical protein